MSEADNSQQEPTMEEILASIRRIISEDGEEEAPAEEADEPEAAAEPEPMAAEPEPEPEEVFEPEPAPEPEPPVLELTEPFEDDQDVAFEEPEVDFVDRVEEPEPEPEPEPVRAEPGPDGLIGDVAAGAAAAAFGRLSQHIAVSVDDAVTLEQIVRDMLKPLLKDWLDENLPGLVERLVEEEISRVTRLRTRD